MSLPVTKIAPACKSLATLVLLAVALCFAGSACAQAPNGLVLIKAARLLDPRTGNVLSPAAVLIEDGKIKEVGEPARMQASAPAGVKIIDLGSAMLLPGLIDSHTHLLLDVVVPAEAQIKRMSNGLFAPGLLLAITRSPSERLLLGAKLAREDLESGFTTVRNLGHSGIDGDVALRDAINAGRVPGPRMQASARKLISPGDYLQDLNPALATAIVQQDMLPIESADGARQAVRANVSYGADAIKLALNDNLTQAEVSAIVDEAHHQNLKVAVHATSAGSIQMAIDAGADSIEHGNGLTDEQLKVMRDKGIFVVLTPTSYNGRLARILEANITMSPAYKAAQTGSIERSRKTYDSLVQRVLKSGVKFALGSDMCWFTPGKTRGEATADVLFSMGDTGMPALAVIRAVTTNAAELLGWQDRVGAIEPGKFADLIAVAGDPRNDLHELERVRFVMKGGQVVRNELAPH
ncbi:MAG: amidohydrolase family protein [Betaproteobacteria bacterium]|nr:amidohydrolase family protein [Betaproteobacteria bacterium]